MASESYFLCIEKSSQGDAVLHLSVLNIAGRGFAFYGSTNDSRSLSLWLIFKGKNNPEEIKKQLEAILPVTKVTVIPLSNPIKESEITDLRTVFLKIGWDSQNVSDGDLSMFINSKLHGQVSHYIDIDHKKKRVLPLKIHIKPIQLHPQFTTDWLKKREINLQDLPAKEFKLSDLKIEEHEFTNNTKIQKKVKPK